MARRLSRALEINGMDKIIFHTIQEKRCGGSLASENVFYVLTDTYHATKSLCMIDVTNFPPDRLPGVPARLLPMWDTFSAKRAM